MLREMEEHVWILKVAGDLVRSLEATNLWKQNQEASDLYD